MIDGTRIKTMFAAMADAMDENRDALCKLDGEIGDADHGIAMAGGFGAVRKAVAELPDSATPTEVMNAAAKSFLSAVGASSGPLYATAFMRGAAAVKGKAELAAEDIAPILAAMAEGIAFRGKANPGDKTMLDAWIPAAETAKAATGDAVTILTAAAEAAETGAETTKKMQASMGRAARLGERAIGHKDPGAASAALLIRAMAAALKD